MHILYVVQYFNLPNEPGGGRAYHFAHRWVEAGHRVTVLTGTLNHKTGSVPERYRGRAFVRESIEGIELLRCASPAPVGGGLRGRLLNFLTFAFLSVWAGIFKVERPDVVFASSTPLTVGLPGWTASRRWGSGFIFEVRDLWPESAVVAGVLRKRWMIRLAESFESFLYRAADRVVAVTRGIRDGLLARGVPEERALFVPNGVDDILADRPEDAELPQGGAADGRFLCLYLGAMGRWNGNETLLEAARHLAEEDGLEFRFIGDGDRRSALEEQARLWKLDSVRFLGALPKREAVGHLLKADLCLIATWDHPFHRMVLANKIFDYLAAGKPVVAAADGEMADLLGEAGAGRAVRPGDGRLVAEAIRELRSLPAEERAAMGSRGRRHVLAHYRRRDLADRVEGALGAVVRERRE